MRTKEDRLIDGIHKLRCITEYKFYECDRLIGLCGNTELDDIILPIAKMWDKHSGCYGWPVPSPDTPRTAMGAYFEADDLYTGEYGALRIELAKFVLNWIENNRDKALKMMDDTYFNID